MKTKAGKWFSKITTYQPLTVFLLTTYQPIYLVPPGSSQGKGIALLVIYTVYDNKAFLLRISQSSAAIRTGTSGLAGTHPEELGRVDNAASDGLEIELHLHTATEGEQNIYGR